MNFPIDLQNRWHGKRFNSYNRVLKDTFAARVYKIGLRMDFTCPNRDGRVAVGGCAYCNNNSFRPPSAIKTDPIRDQVRDGIQYIRKRFEANKFIIYFQPFSNTYAGRPFVKAIEPAKVTLGSVVGTNLATVGATAGSSFCPWRIDERSFA